MNRHLKNKKFAMKQRQNKRFLWIVLVVGMTLLFAAILSVYSPKLSSKSPGFFSTYYAQIKTWMIERRSHLKKKTAPIKHLIAKQNDSEPQIHFEFYTALPNMQINAPYPMTDKSPHAPVSKANIDVATADELEQELSQALKREK